MNSHQRGYNRQWRKARLVHLAQEPLCRFCLGLDCIVEATVVDHIIPHKGDKDLFWDTDNWQSLCKTCHDSIKSRMENGKEVVTTGQDGWPIGCA